MVFAKGWFYILMLVYPIYIYPIFWQIFRSALALLWLISITSSSQSDYCAFHLTFAQHPQPVHSALQKYTYPHDMCALNCCQWPMNHSILLYAFQTFGSAFCTHVRQIAVVKFNFVHFLMIIIFGIFQQYTNLHFHVHPSGIVFCSFVCFVDLYLVSVFPPPFFYLPFCLRIPKVVYVRFASTALRQLINYLWWFCLGFCKYGNVFLLIIYTWYLSCQSHRCVCVATPVDT